VWAHPGDGEGYRTGMDPSEEAPVRTARRTMIVTVGGLLVVLAIMLVIVLVLGDPTSDSGERQPTPSPAETSGSS
jgi:hypothetical protein